MDSDDELEGVEKSLMAVEVKDPTELIDFELVHLLQLCNMLHHRHKIGNDDYEDDIMMKSFSLGQKTKQKLLVFDMDETLVAARFKTRAPEGFKPDFDYDFEG